MPSPLRIDAHHHVWELARRPHHWLDDPALAPIRADFPLAAFAPEAAAAGVGGSVQVLHEPGETREFLAMAAGSSLIAGVVLDAFGPSRLMYGSDWPVCLLAGSYAAWTTAAEALLAELSASERAAVFHGTATAVYNLT